MSSTIKNVDCYNKTEIILSLQFVRAEVGVDMCPASIVCAQSGSAPSQSDNQTFCSTI